MLEQTDTSAQGRLAFLRQYAPWTALPDETLRQVAMVMRPMAHSARQTIIRQGESGYRLYVLTLGRAEVWVQAEEDTEVSVGTLAEGDCFGEMSLLSGEATSADVVAIEDAETLSLDREAFNALVAANPELLREFARMVSHRMNETTLHMGAARQKERTLTRFLQDQKSERYSELVSGHAVAKELWHQIDKHAQLESPLLIQGERGTGKELFARLVHAQSSRKDGALISVECAQITEITWGDKLFGDYHRKEQGKPHPRAFCHMDLAEGGTVLLKNVDSLPPTVQERLSRFIEKESWEAGSARRRDVRVIATCRYEVLDAGKRGNLSPELAEVLSRQVVVVPPLRARKRDIPALVNHFVSKHAQRLNKQVVGAEDQATIKLVSYDYKIANVQELEEVVERAVILTDGETIRAEEIFLGPPPAAHPWEFNLLRRANPMVRLALRVFPRGIQGLAAAAFAFILYQCFFAPVRAGENLGTLLVWSVWWPALVLSFFFVGRVWCAVCPMALAGATAQRALNLKWRIPAWLRNHDTQIGMAGFFAIIWVEEGTGMRHSALATGLLLLSILGGAIITSVMFPRRTWCRYLCPLGGFAGLSSTTAVMELRPTADICAAKCRDHTCYKGDADTDGCPLSNHLMFVDSNQHCVLCMSCVVSCPNSSPKLNLRPPARELSTGLSARPELGRFVVLLLGLLVALTLIQSWERQPYGLLPRLLDEHRFVLVTGVLALSAAIPLLSLWLVMRCLGKSPDPATAAQFWRKIMAWVPLVTAGFVCYWLAFVPGLDGLQATFTYQPLTGGGARAISFSLLALVWFGILTAGLAVTGGVLWRLWRAEAGSAGEASLGDRVLTGAAACGYWALVLTLMLEGKWLLR